MMYIVHGLLTLYISGNDDMTEGMMKEELEHSVIMLLDVK
jgi:hypothetical protein